MIEDAGAKPIRKIEQGKADLDTYGYCIHRDLLTRGETRALLERLDEQAHLEREAGVAWLGNGARGGNTWMGYPRDANGTAPWQGIRTLLNKGRVFIDLAMNATILDYMRHAFMGREFYLSSTNGLILRRGAVPMVTHTDQLYVPFQTPIPIVTNVMICLSDFVEEMGATRVVPRSHLGPPPKLELDLTKMDLYNSEPIETIAVECEAGCAIVFDGRLWHSSGAHRSDRTRYSVSTYFALPFVRPQDDYPASMRDDVYASLGDAERAMFGFKTGPLGRIDPRFPGDRTNVDFKAPFIPELRAGGSSHAIALVQKDKNAEPNAFAPEAVKRPDNGRRGGR